MCSIIQHFKKTLFAMLCLCCYMHGHTQGDTIRLSIADFPDLGKYHSTSRSFDNKVIPYGIHYYLRQAHFFDSVINHCRGWVVLYPIATEGINNLKLKKPLLIKPGITEDSVFRYLKKRKYFSGGGVLFMSDMPRKIKVDGVSSLNVIDYSMYLSARYFGLPGEDIFASASEDRGIQFEFDMHPAYGEDSIILLIPDIKNHNFQTLQLRDCYISNNLFSVYIDHRNLKSVSIYESYIDKFTMIKDTLSSDFKIEDCTINELMFDSVLFNGSFVCDHYFLSCSDTTPLYIDNCSFSGKCIVSEDFDDNDGRPSFLRSYSININSSSFQGYSQFSGAIRANFVRDEFGGICKYSEGGSEHTGFTLRFHNTKFAGPVLIDEGCMAYSDFDKSAIGGAFSVVNYKFSYKPIYPDSEYIARNGLTGLANCNFAQKSKFIVAPSAPFNLYHLSIYNLDNVDLLLKYHELSDSFYSAIAADGLQQIDTKSGWLFPPRWNRFLYRYNMFSRYNMFVDTVFDDQASEGDIFFSSLREAIAKNPTTDIELKNDMLDKCQYWKSLAGLDWLYSGHGVKWFLFSYIKIVCNFGYHGAWPFIVWSFIIVLFISCAFYLSGKSKISYYISLGGEIDNCFETQYNTVRQYPMSHTKLSGRLIYKLRQWVSCFWLAAFIYVNPKFPVKFFYIRGGLFIWMFICWAVGIVMVLILLIFIAAKASFLRTLLAL